jgi:hypothetical protein
MSSPKKDPKIFQKDSTHPIWCAKVSNYTEIDRNGREKSVQGCK